jgi:Ca2+-transporting ATPase
LFTQGLRGNLPLLAAVLFTVALQLAIIYLPALNALFKTEALAAAELGFCVAMSAVVFFAVEAEKWLVRRGRLYHEPASAGGA